MEREIQCLKLRLSSEDPEAERFGKIAQLLQQASEESKGLMERVNMRREMRSRAEEEDESFETPMKKEETEVERIGMSSAGSSEGLVVLRVREDGESCAAAGVQGREFGFLGAAAGLHGREFGVLGAAAGERGREVRASGRC